MNRPSHWILLFSAAVGAGLWWTGHIGAWLEGVPRPTERSETRPTTSVPSAAAAEDVVRRAALHPTASGRLEGRVIDRFGWPVAGVAVRVLGGSDVVRTDSGGRFELPVDGLGVRRVQFGTADVVHLEELANAGFPRTVVLPDPLPWQSSVPDWTSIPSTPVVLAGQTVVKDESGAPAVGAWVGVVETGAVARTNDDGRVRLPLRPGEPATLVAWDEQGRAAASDAGEPTRDFGIVPLPDLTVTDGYVVRGMLRDSNGDPVPAPVRLREGGIVREIASDAEGQFAFDGLVGGFYEVEVLPHCGVLGLKRGVQVARDMDVDIQLERDQPLRLQVVDRSRRLLTGVHVLARDDEDRKAHGVTDDSGAVVVRGLGAGELAFEVRDAKLEPMRVDSWTRTERTLVVAAQ